MLLMRTDLLCILMDPICGHCRRYRLRKHTPALRESDCFRCIAPFGSKTSPLVVGNNKGEDPLFDEICTADPQMFALPRKSANHRTSRKRQLPLQKTFRERTFSLLLLTITRERYAPDGRHTASDEQNVANPQNCALPQSLANPRDLDGNDWAGYAIPNDSLNRQKILPHGLFLSALLSARAGRRMMPG